MCSYASHLFDPQPGLGSPGSSGYSRRLYSCVRLSRGSHKNRLVSMNSTVSWIERACTGFWESAEQREDAPGLSTQDEAPSGRAGYDLPRLLLRRHGAGAARSSGRMAQERMANEGTAEASPVNNQWLCRTVRRAECGCDYKVFWY